MGRLSESLKSGANRIDKVKKGVRKMKDIGDEMAENTVRVADAALRTGYAYAKAEAEAVAGEIVSEEDDRPLLPAAEPAENEGDIVWTKDSLKEKFGSLNAAYGYLKDRFDVTLSKRSWNTVVAAFNKPKAPSLGDRVTQLERIVAQQQQYIAALEQKIEAIAQQLKKR